MNAKLFDVVKRRQDEGRCILCGSITQLNPSVPLEHATLGLVAVCERHIKMPKEKA